ncbi:RHS repeat-associated core domain-containing protein [Maridesulfovibrio frigidus]|uniref:RHS repeat-associated core domain-containing protein n=1 Tax=Maridesulfovibrio frigidus TaxID=340956 RepID=UPI0004E15045|nr:RHS repeat-associated core domain-containing protein [Maridesulfovibrio frigidus]
MGTLSDFILKEKKWDDLSLSLRMYGKNEPPEMQLENMYELVSRANGTRFEEPRFEQSEFSHSDRMYPSMMKPEVKSRWDQQKRSYEQERDQYKKIKRFAHANFMSENPSHPLTQGLTKTSYGQEVYSELEQLMRHQNQQRQQGQQHSGPQSGTGKSIHDEMKRDSVDLRGATDQLVKFTSPESDEVFAALATERDETGRVVDKSFASAESQHELNYKYDSEGRLITTYYFGKAVEVYGYNNQGQRTQSHVTGGKLSNYTYNQIGQLVQAGTTTYRYNGDGDLVEKNESGQITRYNYLTTGQLCEVILPDESIIKYRFDENGLRTEKLINDKLYQRYQWADLTTLAAVEDSTGTTRFQYNEDGDPIAMAKGKDVYLLATDQLGSIFTVADMDGNSLQEVLYGSFGRRTQNSNPDHDLYLGFAAGLHDKDTGLIHFGYREYDPAIGRFITPDPMGYDGGDVDVYGYCLDDPINFHDRVGLAQVHERRLKGLEFLDEPSGKILKKVLHTTTNLGRLAKAFPEKFDQLLDDNNIKLKHEFIKYDNADETKDEKTNSGFSNEGVTHDEVGKSTPIGKHFDDKIARQAEKNIKKSGKYTPEKYRAMGNNCQNFTEDHANECENIQKKEKK